jgi:hypothetical protein
MNFGGQNILLEGFGTTTLTGFVDGAGGTAGHYDVGIDTLVFTMSLNATTDAYTFTLNEPIDNGSGITFTDFGGISGGNSHFFAINTPGADDLLATAQPTLTETVNTNANNFGVSGSQAVNAGETLQFEFVTWTAGFPPPNPVSINDLFGVYGGMIDENGFKFGLDNVKVGSTAQLTVSLFEENAPQIFSDNGNVLTHTVTPVDVSEIIIISGGNTYIFDNDGATETQAGIFVDLTTDTAHITGLHQGDVIEVFGITDFNDITITDTSGNDSSSTGSDFKVNSPSLLSTATGDPLNMTFGTTQTDTDGDTASGSIALTLDPSASDTTVLGGPRADTIIGGAGNDTLTGNGGDDLFVLQQNGGGHDTITDLKVSGADEIFVDIAAQNLTIATATVLDVSNFHTGDETLAATWNGGTGNEFVWNATTHELWFSANGTGTDKIDLAHISTGTPVASDIHTF